MTDFVLGGALGAAVLGLARLAGFDAYRSSIGLFLFSLALTVWSVLRERRLARQVAAFDAEIQALQAEAERMERLAAQPPLLPTSEN